MELVLFSFALRQDKQISGQNLLTSAKRALLNLGESENPKRMNLMTVVLFLPAAIVLKFLQTAALTGLFVIFFLPF